jgi:hypothetical protein
VLARQAAAVGRKRGWEVRNMKNRRNGVKDLPVGGSRGGLEGIPLGVR